MEEKMIPKNLKVGDKFTDGNRTYEVTKVVPLGYESRLVASAPAVGYRSESAQEAPEATIKDSKLDSFNTYTKTEINRLKNDELEALCDQLGLEKDTGILMKKKIIDHLGL
jgi:hypothetical protein